MYINKNKIYKMEKLNLTSDELSAPNMKLLFDRHY